MRPLTARQREVLIQIKIHLEQTGFPPTRVEIAGALGFRSANAAEDHLKALARKGMIELCAGTSRGIRLLPPAEDELRRCLGAGRTGAGNAGSGTDASPRAAEAAGGMPDGRILMLPVVGRVAAGRPILADSHVESTHPVDGRLFGQRPDYLLRIRGDSMRDAGLLDGDLLAVRAGEEARSGQIVVVRLGRDIMVRRLKQAGPGGSIELLPDNPAFEPIALPAGSADVSIEGHGVGLIRVFRVH